jgi:phage gp36-like protein
MRKFFFILWAVIITALGTGVEVFASTQHTKREDLMAYCSLSDLQNTYGEDRIAGWSRLNPDIADRAITDAGAEIDGYLLSGGYTIPLKGTPANIKKYCIDIACANLVLSAGVMDIDPGGKAVLEQAKMARQYLTKVAEGKFIVPGASGDNEVSKPPTGGIQVRTRARLDLRGY